MRKLIIGGLAVSVLLTICVIRAADLRATRRDTIAAAHARGDNLALIISEYIGESFHAADASLRQLALHSRRIGGAAAPPEEWNPSLSSARAGLTGVGAITVVDGDGFIRHSTRPEIVGESRREDYIIREALRTADDELIVGTPFPTRGTPELPSQLILPIGRRLASDTGEPAGAVVASFRPEAPRSLLRQVSVGANGSIAVFHREGVVLFQEPEDRNPMGDSAADHPIFAALTAAHGGSGFVEGPGRPGGPILLTAFRSTATPPLMVAVSIDRDELLAGWRREVGNAIVILIVATAVLGGVLVALFRQMDAKTSAEEALRQAQALEQERLREANERLAASLARERAARSDAEAASALKDDFLMTVSHELRTPLTAIYGWARMLSQGVVGERQRGLALNTIERNAEAQRRLIDDLLDVSAIGSGKVRLDMQSVSPEDVVRSACDSLAPAAAAKSIRIEARVQPDAGALAGDPERVQQIVWNLMANAVKFTPRGGRIRVDVSRDADHVLVAVEDDGIGISPEFLPHVFDRFRQEDAGSGRHYAGLGLGLAIVRSLVELHGGSIEAHSAGIGKGSRFIVRLPRATTDLTARREQRRPGAGGTPPRIDGLRILVVDDNAEARELFTVVLGSAGAAVTAESTMAGALARLRSGSYDVLLSDLEMPGGGGHTLGREALACAATRGERLITIAVSAYSREGDVARGAAAGFVRHIGKPVDPSALVSIIADCFAVSDQTPPAVRGEASH